MEADTLNQIALPSAMFIIMFSLGTTMTKAQFSNVITHPKGPLVGLISQMVLLPICVLILVEFIPIQSHLALGFVILALCPGGSTSNLLTYLARGDTALSVSLTAINSIIVPFSLPLILAMIAAVKFDRSISLTLPFDRLMISLIFISLLPVGLGMLFRMYNPILAEKIKKPLTVVSVLFLALIIIGIVAQNVEMILDNFSEIILFALALNLLALFFGFFVAYFTKQSLERCKTIAIETGMQNGTLAILVAATLLNDPKLAIAATFYSLIMFISGGFFVVSIRYFVKR
jgi:BASS family bile acid:Na+ symporter